MCKLTKFRTTASSLQSKVNERDHVLRYPVILWALVLCLVGCWVSWLLGWLVDSLLHLEEQGEVGEADATGNILVEEEAPKCSDKVGEQTGQEEEKYLVAWLQGRSESDDEHC